MAAKCQSLHSTNLHALSAERVKVIRGRLLEWYGREARVLPWRVPSTPFEDTPYEDYVARLYRCLLSETMLQQTQVKTVIAYYTKWLDKFPTIEILADASEEDVMACWAGLGYYSRANRLQQAAQYLVTNYVSSKLEFPRSPEYWIKNVPGVGPYTAGAILSIAFGIPSAIVDGNVQRVLSRVLAIHGDTSTPKSSGTKLVWERAAQLVDGADPGHLNQSMMELGATICTPTQPNCASCPINQECTAYRQFKQHKSSRKSFFAKSDSQAAVSSTPVVDVEDLCTICSDAIDPSVLPEKSDTYIQSLYPFKPQKKAQREETALVMVIIKDEEIYLEKKAKGLLAGLFDFPTILLDATDVPDTDAIVAKHKRKLGATNAGTTLHVFTHIRRTSHVLRSNHEQARKALDAFAEANGTGRWVQADKLDSLGVSELCLKNWRLATGVLKESRKRRDETLSLATVPVKKQVKSSQVVKEEEDVVSESSDLPLSESSTLDANRVIPSPEVLAKVAMVEKRAAQSKIFSMFERKRIV